MWPAFRLRGPPRSFDPVVPGGVTFTAVVSKRPAFFVFLFVVALAALPHLRAVVAPPRGQSYVGTFLSREDFYNYLGYVQQAEDGSWLFVNKLDTEAQRPVMLNLEWWLVGRLSALLGRRPLVAFWVLGLLATGALLAAANRWLRLAGLAEPWRARALLLIFLGGGLGGLRYQVLGPPAWRSLDLIAGLFPFIEIVANPHFVTATALLAWALLALQGASPRAQLAGVALGTALGLSRPYDLVLLVGIRGLAVLLCEPRGLWLKRLSPLAGLLPVVAYLYWLFYRSGAFATFFSGYVSFPAIDLAVALGPAVLLVALVWRPRKWGSEGHAPEAHLAAWAAIGIFLLVVRPVGFYFQALVGIGLPLLALAALGLGRLRPVFTLTVAALMSTTSLVALHIFLGDQPRWYVPRENKLAALALRAVCRPGDVALSQPDIGLLALAYSPCKAYVSERHRPEDREHEAAQFYGAGTPEWRAAFLERAAMVAIVLPGDPGERPTEWLGPETSVRKVATVGAFPRQLTVYSKADRTSGAPASSP